MKNKLIKCGKLSISNNSPFTLIAGPCQLENEKHAISVAEQLKKISRIPKKGEYYTVRDIVEYPEYSRVGIRLEEGTEGGTGALQLDKLKGARLQEPEKLQSIFKLPKNTVKTLLTEDNNGVSQTELTFRKQFVGTTSAAGTVSFSAGSGETFVIFAEKDYTMSILTAGDGTGSQGDIVSVSGVNGTGSSKITITEDITATKSTIKYSVDSIL